MSKAKSPLKDTLRKGYTRADFPDGLQRGRYATRAASASNFVVIDADLAAAFPDSAAVNDALRVVLKAARRVASQT